MFESVYMKLKKSLSSRQKQFVFSPWDFIGNNLNRQVTLIGQYQQSCARVSGWSISIHNWVYIFPSVDCSIYVLKFYTLKSVRRKAFLTCFKMFAFFKAIFKFCTAIMNHRFIRSSLCKQISLPNFDFFLKNII